LLITCGFGSPLASCAPIEPMLVINEGHHADTAAIAICAQGRIAITAPEYRDDIDRAPLKLWDLHTGRLVTNLEGYDFALAPDHRFLYVNRTLTNRNAKESTAIIEKWQLDPFIKIASFQSHYRITRVSNDGLRALSADSYQSYDRAQESF